MNKSPTKGVRLNWRSHFFCKKKTFCLMRSKRIWSFFKKCRFWVVFFDPQNQIYRLGRFSDFFHHPCSESSTKAVPYHQGKVKVKVRKHPGWVVSKKWTFPQVWKKWKFCWTSPWNGQKVKVFSHSHFEKNTTAGNIRPLLWLFIAESVSKSRNFDFHFSLMIRNGLSKKTELVEFYKFEHETSERMENSKFNHSS